MNSKVNYTLVGTFVLLLGLAFVVIVVWLSTGLSTKHYNYYYVVTSESVSGLSVQSPVKYNGLQVGYVANIALNDRDPSQVKLLLAVDSSVPIHENTTAQIEVQGLTGVGFMGLRGGTPDSPLLVVKNKTEKYPTIATRPSLFTRLDVTLSLLSTKLNEIASAMQSITDKPNQIALHNSLMNIATITQSVANNTQHLNHTLSNLDLITQNAMQASKTLPLVVDDAKISFQQISRTMQQGQKTLANISNNVTPQLQITLQNIANLTQKLSNFSSELEQNPAILIHGKKEAAPGPGEMSQ